MRRRFADEHSDHAGYGGSMEIEMNGDEFEDEEEESEDDFDDEEESDEEDDEEDDE